MHHVVQVTSGNVAPMVRWRRVCARIDADQAPDPEDATWLAEVCREAIEGGAPLREVFGLPGRGGAGGLARVVRLAQRDGLLRQLHTSCFPGLSARQAANEISALVARQRRSSRAPCNERERRMAELLALAEVPAAKRLRVILARSKAL